MNKSWYLPIAALAGAASLTVWTAATAGPPTAVNPGVKVVVDDTPRSDTATASNIAPSTAGDTSGTEDSPKPDDPPSFLPMPAPAASVTAIPEHSAPQTQLVPVQLQTFAPLETTDDKGGLRDKGASDDGPTHDSHDDKGGER